ncbi:SusC/RagA family TonB-linked outer membrane protein [Sphingobacterium lumbrici]|uniref:SusC/RagA family TonB-linked outer membrane protein n=1 Tax=Sphingobacterium lumbrici TaxID=2559600 RepID=UPI00112A8421|nr:SusC/RagA family TonB-linked outer membrane protein [Sphingobacterium lumbrici]
MIKYVCLIVSLLLTVSISLAQKETVVFLDIRNAEDNSGIAGAVIHTEGIGNSIVVSSTEGKCKLVFTSLPIRIRIAHMAFKKMELEITEGGEQIVYLDPLRRELEEVQIHTGYESIPRERATGSFSSLSEKELERRASPSLVDRLEGTVSGLNLDSRLEGRNNALIVRGYSSIRSDRTPLVILDGAPYEGDLSALDPNIIASITVLKDAAAASIWGARAGNGVLVITTKSASGMGTQVKLNNYLTVGAIPNRHYDAFLLNSQEFIGFERYLFDEGYYNALKSNPGYRSFSPVVGLLLKEASGDISSTVLTEQLAQLGQEDVRLDLDKYLFQNSFEQQHSVQLSESGEKSAHFFSGSWNRNRSYIQRNADQRLALLARSTFKVGSWLELSPNIQYNRGMYRNEGSTYRQIGTGGLYPYARLADGEGNALALIDNYNPLFLEEQESTSRLDWDYRPLEEMALNQNRRENKQLLMSFRTQVNITTGLNLQLLYNYQDISDQLNLLYDRKSYYVRNLRNRYAYEENGTLLFPIADGSILNKEDGRILSHLGRGQVNFSRSWKNSDVNLLAGMEIKQTVGRQSSTMVYGYNPETLTFQTPDLNTRFLTFPQNSRASIPSGIGFSDRTDRFLSYYFNGSYAFKNRYLMSFSARRDASNLFGVNTNQKAVPLWSSGLAWTPSAEDFWSPDFWLSFLKIRATVGYSGNVNKSLTRYSTARYGNTLLTGLPSAQILTPPNEDLRWEKVKTANLGLDFGIEGNKWSGSVDYYQKRGTDLIGEAALDPTTGFFVADKFTFIGNNSELKSQGVDFRLNGNFRVAKLEWTPSLILNWNRDEVVRYSGTNTLALFSSSFSAPIEGKPLNGVFSFPWAGLDPVDGSPRFWYGDEITRDYATLKTNTTFEDLTFHGTSLPVYSGSFFNRLVFRPVELSFSILYGLGHYLRRPSISYEDLATNWVGHSDYSKRWMQAGDEQFTEVPAMPKVADLSLWTMLYTNSSTLIERADYIYLKDIRLAVDLMGVKRLPGKKIVKSADLYLMVNNVGQLWVANSAKLDPLTHESAFGRQRFWTVGLNFGF